jgi:uncharacterized protein (DUF433 family)
MTDEALLQRITCVPGVLAGKPVVATLISPDDNGT